jgi:two-component system phosphate regulon sensor histidine kinase PhoR
VEVAVNPAVVQPLLPYGGKGVPWLVLTLLFVLVIGSPGLAVRSLRRDAELLRLQQDFIGNVSHELRTPLARIRLFNELLMEGRQTDPSKALRYREIIDRECRRLGFLVDKVLDFSRKKRNGRDLTRSELNLRQVIDDGLDSFRSLSDQGRFTLTEHLDDVPPVLGDANGLQQVLINLLDNAVKYSPEGASIEVELTAVNGVALLSVKDEGYGIPVAEQERIFGQFYRVESGEAQRSAGSGLGLSLVKHTVEAHGGRVRVQSQEGRGSLFVVEIPTIAGASRNGEPTAKAGR